MLANGEQRRTDHHVSGQMMGTTKGPPKVFYCKIHFLFRAMDYSLHEQR
jgi:hypothetical protein